MISSKFGIWHLPVMNFMMIFLQEVSLGKFCVLKPRESPWRSAGWESPPAAPLRLTSVIWLCDWRIFMIWTISSSFLSAYFSLSSFWPRFYLDRMRWTWIYLWIYLHDISHEEAFFCDDCLNQSQYLTCLFAPKHLGICSWQKMTKAKDLQVL